MMKSPSVSKLVVLMVMIGLTFGKVLDDKLLNYVYNNNGLGSYSFEYKTSDGSFRKEDGGLISKPDGDTLVVRGEYGYTDPDGHSYYVHYTADEYGFKMGLTDDSETSEDVELRRIFPSEFPQDLVRRTGSLDPEQLGRYAELERYFRYPKADINSHFEELVCYDTDEKKVCKLDENRYSLAEDSYYRSKDPDSHMDHRRVYCFMLICFTEFELDRLVGSF